MRTSWTLFSASLYTIVGLLACGTTERPHGGATDDSTDGSAGSSGGSGGGRAGTAGTAGSAGTMGGSAGTTGGGAGGSGGTAPDCSKVLNEGCDCIVDQTSTCAEIHPQEATCASVVLTCSSAGKWPEQSACRPRSGACLNGGTCNGERICECLALFGGSSCEHPRFRWLGVLGGQTSSAANAVSRDGKIVVGESGSHAVRSVDGGPVTSIASTMDSLGCRAQGVSADGGVIVGICGNGGDWESFRYTTSPSPLKRSDSNNWTVGALSADGSTMLGITSTLRPYVAVRWTATGGFQSVGKIQTTLNSYAGGISRDGSLIVGSEGYPEPTLPWRWTAAVGIVALPLPAGFDTALTSDVSTDGSVIVGSGTLSGDRYALRWSGASWTPTQLGLGRIAATNLDGSVSGGGVDSSTGGTAAIWTSSGMRPIPTLIVDSAFDPDGSSLVSAQDISDDGKVIVGNGRHIDHNEGWVVHLPD